MIDLEKEIKAFSDKYRVKENKIVFDHKRGTWFFEDLSFGDQDEKTLINLRVMWLGWLDCAKQKQSEIDELKAKLAKVESEQHKQASIYQFEINHLTEANEKWKEVKKQAPKGFVLVLKEEINSLRDKAMDAKYFSKTECQEYVRTQFEEIQLSLEAMIEAAQENEDE